MSELPLRILYVAYPMLPVTASVAGGAEQMLWALGREMHRRGHWTSVAASTGSEVSGTLVDTGAAPVEVDAYDQRELDHEERVLGELRRAAGCGDPYDLVHDKGGAFWRRASEVTTPVLATLHLPRHFYPADAFGQVPPNVYFNCVSASQLATFAGVPRVLGAIPNGIHLPVSRGNERRRGDDLLWIGRICEEKGTHLAIEVARRAGLPLTIAGEVYRFSYHQAYFEREVRPHLGTAVRLAGRLSPQEKYDLLSHARALLVTSLVDETSSLVSMEAMACGTPVLALRRGALPEVVQDGVTGFVVDTVSEMAAAVSRADAIDPRVCRAYVESKFTASRMADDYERVYAQVLAAANNSRVTAA